MQTFLSDLKRIYEPSAAGKLMSWKQVKPGLPDIPLKTAGVGIKHGTFEFFSVAIGNNKYVRSDFKDTGNHEETVRFVESDGGAIGFIPMATGIDSAAQVRMVPVDFGQGPVEPTAANITSGKYSAMSRIVYIYFNTALVSKAGPDAERFVKEFVGNMEKYVQFANMVPLSPVQYQESLRRLNFKKP